MKPKKSTFWKVILYAFCGVVIGGINGFFGGGGGMICVPTLLLLGLSNKKAHATAILTMLPISIASGVIYYSNGFIDFWLVFLVSVGSVVGAGIGALLLKKLPSKVIAHIFPIVMILAGIKMLF